MKKPTLRIATSAIATMMVAGAAASLVAHHGTNISYDRSKQFTTQAVVTEFEYRNPHPELHVESRTTRARSPSGRWSCCRIRPSSSATAGAAPRRTKRSKPGTPVMITVAPSKAGGVVGLLLRVATPQRRGAGHGRWRTRADVRAIPTPGVRAAPGAGN